MEKVSTGAECDRSGLPANLFSACILDISDARWDSFYIPSKLRDTVVTVGMEIVESCIDFAKYSEVYQLPPELFKR